MNYCGYSAAEEIQSQQLYGKMPVTQHGYGKADFNLEFDPAKDYYGNYEQYNGMLMVPHSQQSVSPQLATGADPGAYWTTADCPDFDSLQTATAVVDHNGSYASLLTVQAANVVDYQDINSLEPSFLPGQVDLSHNALMQPIDPTNGNLVANGYPNQDPNLYNNSNLSCPINIYQRPINQPNMEKPEDEDTSSYCTYKQSSQSEISPISRNIRQKRQGRKRKPKKDPNEPQKPVSAYALFFRDTQATIKGQNPNASFGEVSKIVATLWDGLNADAKNVSKIINNFIFLQQRLDRADTKMKFAHNAEWVLLEIFTSRVYKQKTESAKKDYLKQLAAYRANLLSKGGNSNACTLQACGEYFHQQKYLLSQSLPDSTSAITEVNDTMIGLNGKTLASLIAEPPPQQVLTATTTLTVPQTSYTTNRMRTEIEVEAEFPLSSNPTGNQTFSQTNGTNEGTSDMHSPNWNHEYSNNDCVVRYCRDAYSDWVEQRKPQPRTFTPV
ncbi:TOX high mobility group box family member 3 [Trichinella zimbabwensis]|uniref:TOX high mobility group box family member 3 n=1 Tax=Trichinella zimbabwensis TaxID=268475 RepID=A0A0V1HGE1_9BILA|nr:TOX high mobility group box family member 3 [Trichinella zimbabwensis]